MTTPHNPRDILIHVHEYLSGQGFFYTRQAIANLYLSLKTKPFVILAGPSGTGKTQMVRLFAEALGHRDHCLLVPVRPDWADSSELLGYVDYQGVYRHKPLLNWVLRAHQRPEEPFFVILDEMNLARVEHYLSEFLSIIETRRWENGEIVTAPLLGLLPEQLRPEDQRLAELGWPANLCLVGTVNMDETTFGLSPKVLDRAQVIEVSEVRLDWPASSEEIPPMEGVKADFLQTKFLQGNDLSEEDKLRLRPAMQWLQKVSAALAPVGLALGYRIRDELAFYLINRVAIRELISEGEALDRQLVQKILPRLQGASPRYGEVLPQLLALLHPEALKDVSDLRQVPFGTLREKVGPKTTQPRPFPQATDKLMAMYQRFEEGGFTTFWD